MTAAASAGPLRAWRVQRGWTSARLSRELGRALHAQGRSAERLPGTGTIEAWEQGRRRPGRVYRLALAALGAPVGPEPKLKTITVSRARIAREAARGRKEEAALGRHAKPEANKRHLPLYRSECETLPRPCPFLTCQFHLALDVTITGGVKYNFAELLDPDGTIRLHEMRDTCALDAADRGGMTLEEVGALINLTRERVRQVEEKRTPALREALEQWRPGRGVTRPDLHRPDTSASDTDEDLTRTAQQGAPGQESWDDTEIDPRSVSVLQIGPPRKKLFAAAKAEVRRRRGQGESIASLALAFNVARVTIRRICRGRSWRRVQ